MKNLRRCILKILSILLIFSFSARAFAADTTPEPYHENEFPQFLKDARRFEIITLGALPFVTLQTNLGYSTIKYVQNDFSAAYFPNPFAASTYSQDEQIGLLFTSLAICAGIGLTDLIIQLIKRGNAKKHTIIQDSDLMITPLEKQKLPLPPEKGFFQSDENISGTSESDDEVELINEVISSNPGDE